MFRTERLQSVVDKGTGLRVWYFLTREGRRGPFTSQVTAQIALHDFIVNKIKLGPANRRTRKLTDR